MHERFSHFAAIDWSGAVGERQQGIAVAICALGSDAPRLVRESWSRAEVLHWLLHDMPTDTLVGMDFGLSLPFVDCGAFFPSWADSPADARALWAMVDHMCAADRHLSVSSFVRHETISQYFRHVGYEGKAFCVPDKPSRRGRFRVTEIESERQIELKCRPYSNFNLVGAAQVGKSSLTGMRLLHRLAGHLPIWPIDTLPASGSVLVEIYTTIAAMRAGRQPGRSKMRTLTELNAGLDVLGTKPLSGTGLISDHRSDALLTAAWLRKEAHRKELWNPAELKPPVPTTEGWTFGVP